MENPNRISRKNSLVANLFLFNTIFMLFTKEFSGTTGIDLSQTSFNVIQLNEDFRSNLLRLAFVVAVEKLIYKFGMLVGLYEFDKGYSDFLSIGVMVAFMIYDKVKWKFRLGGF